MKIYNMERGSGKTTRLIYISEYSDIPILCTTVDAKEQIQALASELKCIIPEPISINDLLNKNSNLRLNEVLVDEAFNVLSEVLKKVGINNIGAITVSEELLRGEINEK